MARKSFLSDCTAVATATYPSYVPSDSEKNRAVLYFKENIAAICDDVEAENGLVLTEVDHTAGGYDDATYELDQWPADYLRMWKDTSENNPALVEGTRLGKYIIFENGILHLAQTEGDYRIVEAAIRLKCAEKMAQGDSNIGAQGALLTAYNNKIAEL